MRQPRAFVTVVFCALLLSCASGTRQTSDTYRLLQTLNADLLASPSATATLERWCREHAMAARPEIVAERVHAARREPSAGQLQRLQVRDPAAVKYRRVRLRCGTHVFSEADNWYVPARLTVQMNEQLDTTDIPFGKVVRPLTPYRRTIDARLLWRGRTRVVPQEVMVHTAVLYTADHQPFSEVVETYQKGLFAFRSGGGSQ